MTSNARSAVLPVLLALVSVGGLFGLAGCNSSSSSAADGPFRLVATIFGFDRINGGFPPTGEGGQPPTIPQNMCLIFEFSAPIDPATVSSESIIVQEVNLNTDPPSPGPDAGASFTVRGNQLVVCPLITFSDTNVTYGFEPNRSYQLSFEIEPAPEVMRSTGGRSLPRPDAGPYVFQTSNRIFDRLPGAPEPTVTLLDANSAADVGSVDVPFKPVPRVQIDFSEPVIPTTVIADGATGAAASLHIEIDLDGDVSTDTDRIVIPGRYTLVQDENSARVSWESLLTEIPTAPDGCAYVVTIDGTVTDLAGNSKVLESNDPSVKDEFVFTTAPGPSDGPSDGAAEDFTSRENESSVSSAEWGTVLPGFLTSGVGGGTGADGAFDPLDSDFPPPELAAQISVDSPNNLVTIQTEDLDNPGTPRVYQFLRGLIPINWRVVATGPFPLIVLTSGDFTIRGELDVSGADGGTNLAGQLTAGQGGMAALGGAAGGNGGALTDGAGVSALFPATTGATYNQLGFMDAAETNQGVSGRVFFVDGTANEFQFTERSTGIDLDTFFGGVDDLWVQPNVGADDYRFERTHTAFKVDSLAFDGTENTITVVSDPGDPDYRGPIVAETDNPYVDDDFRAPLLAEVGDAFVIGRLMGQAGGSAFDVDLDGGSDPTVYAGGQGSEPQTVTQTFTTLGKSGGGGGAGALSDGVAGADDPTVANGPGPFGGTGGRGADGGSAVASLTVREIDVANPETVLRFDDAPFDDGMGGATFVGHLLNPQIGQGQVFTIAAVGAVDECTIAPIATLDGERLDLSTVVDLQAGSTARVTPPYNVGGAGGGGSGVHCASSSKDARGNEGYPLGDARLDDGNPDTNFYDDADGDILEDDSEPIFRLPRWIAGAGGGAGGGVVRLVVAGEVNITGTGSIIADGGNGGVSEVVGAGAASGGGAGAGGTVFIGVGQTLRTSPGALISAVGGIGGNADPEDPDAELDDAVRGGRGGNGRIRIENQAGDLVPGEFQSLTAPVITAENLGPFPGGGNSLGQSEFISGGVLVPDYRSITIQYGYVQGGTDRTGVFKVNRNGAVDPSSTLNPPPFQLLLNYTIADEDTGLPIDPPPANLLAFTDPTQVGSTLADFTGNPYIRFRIVLDDPSDPAFPNQTNVQISSVQIEVNGSKP